MKKALHRWLVKIGDKMGFDLPYFFKNSFWISIRQVIVALSSLIMMAAFSHLVDAEVFGKYQFVLSIISLVMIFSLPGMSTALVQTIARGRDGFYADAFRRSVRMSLVGSGALIVIGLYYLFSDRALGAALFMVAAVFPFISSFGLWEAYLQGRERFDIAARNASLLSVLQSSAVCGVAVFFPQYLVALVVAYAVSAGLANLVFHRMCQVSVRNDETDQQSVQFGYYMTKMGVLGIVSEQIDKLLVGFLLGPTQLAIYAVISFFGLRIKDLVRPFSAMLVPKIATEKMLFREILKTHWRTISLGIIVLFLASILFSILVVPVNKLVFSANYADYSYLSRWYVVTVFFSVPLTAMGYYIYARQNTYAVMLSNTIYHVFRIGINAVLIWRFGLFGAVLAYNVSMLFLLGIYFWGIYREERAISLRQ